MKHVMGITYDITVTGEWLWADCGNSIANALESPQSCTKQQYVYKTKFYKD